MPPLCAKAALPTKGARPLGRWLATSSTKRERSRNSARDRKSTRLNSSHTEIYTLSLHDALPISALVREGGAADEGRAAAGALVGDFIDEKGEVAQLGERSEEHTSELQSHRDLHSFPTRRSSDLRPCARRRRCRRRARGRWGAGWRLHRRKGRGRATRR